MLLSAYPISVLKECLTRAAGRFDVSNTSFPHHLLYFKLKKFNINISITLPDGSYLCQIYPNR